MTNHNLLPADTCDNHFVVVVRRDLELGKEFVEDLTNFHWSVLVDGVAHLVNDYKHEFTLHLSDC